MNLALKAMDFVFKIAIFIHANVKAERGQSKTDEFCIQNEKLRIKNEELCVNKRGNL